MLQTVILWLFISLGDPLAHTFAQQSPDERITQTIKRLEKETDNLDLGKQQLDCVQLDWFLTHLHGSKRTDGRYSWMDKLKQSGIRQVSLELEYKWKKDGIKYRVTSVLYYGDYYLSKTIVRDKQMLAQIRKAGLEKELQNFAITELTKQTGKYQPGTAKEGTDNITLFDDESIPFAQVVY